MIFLKNSRFSILLFTLSFSAFAQDTFNPSGAQNPCEALFSGLDLTSLPPARILINTTDPSLSKEKLERLGQLASSAIEFLEKKVNTQFEPVRISVGNSGTNLRIGYVPEDQTVHFRNTQGVLSSGIESEDVIYHEVFHALMHQKAPELFTPQYVEKKNGSAAHEALADYFAYHLDRNETFGDHYFQDAKLYLRKNRVDMHLGLVEGEHEVGNILSSFFIKNNIPLEELWKLILKGQIDIQDFMRLSDPLRLDLQKSISYQVENAPLNLPKSQINKYQVSEQTPLQIQFTPNESLLRDYRDLKIEWYNKDSSTPDGFIFKQDQNDRFKFTVTPKKGAKREKVFAVYLSGDKILGEKAFYFGPELERRPVAGSTP